MTYSADNKKHETTPGKDRARLALLILASMMTMMGASAVAPPSLPGISAAFSEYPESMVTMIVTLPSLAIVLSGWCIGLICDRVGKTRLLIISLALFALFGSSGAYLSSLEMILLGRAFLGVAIAGIMTTTTALISTYYTGRERARVIGYQSAGMGMGACSGSLRRISRIHRLEGNVCHLPHCPALHSRHTSDHEGAATKERGFRRDRCPR
ncbi:MFS transporter [Methanogenium cariaci]|uniref:MFS transporter n=1 Tax=Methanogenium cariaci TaxID=2197 RepID=UPI0007855158|nr:MFS transporter [Methanogenium cariaci]